jgi:tetratricopeptide (TPR) repeat protein
MKPADSQQMVQASVGFFFTDRPASPPPLMLRLGRQNIDIAPGDARYTIEDRYALPVDVTVVGVQPHAHYRAREVSGFALLPDGTRKRLIEIKDWDFSWQDAYRYAEPFTLPRGTVLALRYTYDNSASNRRNPDRPPKRVRWGQNSADEMGDLWIQVLPRTNQERDVLRADFGPKVMAEDAVGYETMLEVDRANPRLHEAAAAIYLSLGRLDAAVTHLEDALLLDPRSAEGHYNLATALLRQGRLELSIEHFRRALQIQPDHVRAHVNLGVAFRAQKRFDEAALQLQTALQLDPRSAAAHTNLAGILAAQQRTREAITHYQQALATNRDLLEALIDLSWILAMDPDRQVHDPGEAVRLAERAAALTKRQDIRALETLAAALAASGRFDRAVVAMQEAVAIADRAGSAEMVRQLRERLELYRRKILP